MNPCHSGDQKSVRIPHTVRAESAYSAQIRAEYTGECKDLVPVIPSGLRRVFPDTHTHASQHLTSTSQPSASIPYRRHLQCIQVGSPRSPRNNRRAFVRQDDFDRFERKPRARLYQNRTVRVVLERLYEDHSRSPQCQSCTPIHRWRRTPS
jgi:hypothetical protein